MKTASSELLALLATRAFCYAGIYQFSLIDGTNLYYSAGDVDVKFGGNTYTAGGTTGPYFDRKDNKAKAHWIVGLQVDTLVFDVVPGDALIEGEGFRSAVRQGVFDGAELTYSKAYWPQQAYQNPVTPTGIVVMFVGRVAEVDCGRSLATFSVNSHLELLNQNLPRNLYQAGCLNTLYDTACTLNKASYGVTGTAIVSASNVVVANMTQPSGYFDLGTVTFTSGANGGLSRTVKNWVNATPGAMYLLSPFPNPPRTGDTFTAYPGCDKTSSTCGGKFNNIAQFRGFPFVPANETSS